MNICTECAHYYRDKQHKINNEFAHKCCTEQATTIHIDIITGSQTFNHLSCMKMRSSYLCMYEGKLFIQKQPSWIHKLLIRIIGGSTPNHTHVITY